MSIEGFTIENSKWTTQSRPLSPSINLCLVRRCGTQVESMIPLLSSISTNLWGTACLSLSCHVLVSITDVLVLLTGAPWALDLLHSYRSLLSATLPMALSIQTLPHTTLRQRTLSLLSGPSTQTPPSLTDKPLLKYCVGWGSSPLLFPPSRPYGKPGNGPHLPLRLARVFTAQLTPRVSEQEGWESWEFLKDRLQIDYILSRSPPCHELVSLFISFGVHGIFFS